MNAIWQAFAREAGLAAEHLAIGVTALGKADYTQPAYYEQAFFALSIGLERAAKIALVLNYSLDNEGTYPNNKQLSAYGHNLDVLLQELDKIAQQRQLQEHKVRLPNSQVHQAIITTLSDFARNITRYYNLDLITNSQRIVGHDDPIKAWQEQVVNKILEKHRDPQKQEQQEHEARVMGSFLSAMAIFRFHDEMGELLETAYDATLRMEETDFAKPFVRLYVMQIIRFVVNVLCGLADTTWGMKGDDISYLSEFFAIFLSDDDYIMRHETWSIYGRQMVLDKVNEGE